MQLVYLTKFCIIIVFDFSWDDCNTLACERRRISSRRFSPPELVLDTMVKQNFGRLTRCTVVSVNMVNFKSGPASRSLSLILGIFELINKESRGHHPRFKGPCSSLNLGKTCGVGVILIACKFSYRPAWIAPPPPPPSLRQLTLIIVSVLC